VREMFKHQDFQFGYETALGSAYRGYAEVGEVLSTAGRIKDGDADEWVREWCATAERLEAVAQEAEAAGRRVSARSLYLRASSYFSTGLYLITHSGAPGRQLDIWRRHRACWDKLVDLAPVPGERLQVPYEGTTLPGYFFRAPGAAPGERRPLVVMSNGSDGPTSHMGLFGGWAANERGYHWMTVDGPGQQASLFLNGIPFRHDWEAVLTPVVHAMAARPDVDADRVALIGISQGGFWVPRALAVEHRFVAAVADPRGGRRVHLLDRAAARLHARPGPGPVQAGRLRPGDGLDRALLQVDPGDPALPRRALRRRWRLALRPLPGGPEVPARRRGRRHHHSPADTEPEDEQFWPGQSQALYDRLPGPKQLVRFTAAEGANRHCEPTGLATRDVRIFDWLDRHLAA